MTDMLPFHPLTLSQDFRNPEKVLVGTWHVLKKYRRIVVVTGNEGEVKWVEWAWRKIERTIWAQHSDEFEWHRVLVRFFALAEIVRIYCHLAQIQDFEREYIYGEWIDECDLSKVKLAVMCGEKFLEDEFVDSDGAYQTIDHLLNQEYPNIIRILQNCLGSNDGIMKSLHAAIEGNEEGETVEFSDEFLEAADLHVPREVVNLWMWRDDDFRRRVLDG